MVDRQVLWNREIDEGEQVRMRYRYTVAIVNEPREIKKIRRRFLEQLARAEDVTNIHNSTIPNTNGLHLDIFSFSSEQPLINYPSKIYDVHERFKRDQNLTEKDEKELGPYIDRLVR